MLNLLLSPVLLLPILLGIYVFILRKENLIENISQSNKWKLFNVIFTILAIIPIAYLLYAASFAYYFNQTDYWYNKSAKKVNFHLYKIIPPEGLIVNSTYQTGNKFSINVSNAVSIYIDLPLKEKFKSKPSTIRVRQVGVSNDFDLDKFIYEEYPATASVSIIPIKLTPLQNIGLLRKVKSENESFFPHDFYFKTNDNVLVSITSVNGTLEKTYFITKSFFPNVDLKPEIITQTPILQSE